MKLHQLRYLCEISRQGLSFSSAATALHTSQPGISKQIRLLEEELGVDLFIRNGNRIVEMTEPARRIAAIASLVLRELEDIKAVAEEFREGGSGHLNIAATFTFARYILPEAFRNFVSRHPNVKVNLLQDSPAQVSRLASSGEADIAMTTRPAEDFPDLLFLEYCKLPRILLVPGVHPLLREKRVTLKAISMHPLITLDVGSHGQLQMRELFARSHLEPNIVFAGVDVDVVKAFVEAGLGIAVLPKLAFEPRRDSKLRALDVNHLFDPHVGCLAIRKNHYLRGYAFDFIKLLASNLDRRAVEKAIATARAAA
ncbi:MAG: LysR family transcriptional regulator [Burkholderiales bacterium]|nr:LysR family transcriptional regulator [Burkholderiales bacterium]